MSEQFPELYSLANVNEHFRGQGGGVDPRCHHAEGQQYQEKHPGRSDQADAQQPQPR
jgi:hypothetical protein